VGHLNTPVNSEALTAAKLIKSSRAINRVNLLTIADVSGTISHDKDKDVS
jgi:hypothetical protein